jgi:hypothetical protein
MVVRDADRPRQKDQRPPGSPGGPAPSGPNSVPTNRFPAPAPFHAPPE